VKCSTAFGLEEPPASSEAVAEPGSRDWRWSSAFFIGYSFPRLHLSAGTMLGECLNGGAEGIFIAV
jgi:hypothetical protein